MKAVVLLLIVVLFCISAVAQEPGFEGGPVDGNSLSEVRDKQRALLVVFKSRVLDVNDRERAIINDVLKADPHPKGRYRWVYGKWPRNSTATCASTAACQRQATSPRLTT